MASSDDAIVSKDLNGIIQSWNAAAERIFGYTAAEAVGQPITLIIPLERRSEEVDIIKRLRRGERVEHFETVRVAKDGREVRVSLTISPIHDATGRVIGASKIARDVTEARRVAEERDAQREWLRVTLASIGDAVITSDPAGKVTFINPVAERLTGWTKEDAAGRPLAEVFHIVDEKTHEPADDPVGKVMRSGQVVGLANHTLLIGRDGREHSIADSAAPIRGDGGQVLGVVLVFRDVTQARRMEDALAEQREWLETTLEGIGDAVLTTDIHCNVVFMNPVAERLVGLTKEEAKGRPCHEVFNIVNEITRRPAESPVARVMKDGAVVGLANHTVLISADGTERPIDDSAAPIRSRDGRIVGVVLVFRDVTDRRHIEADRQVVILERERLLESERAARAEAERANALKDQFVAMVSHELRTPLNAMLGWIDILANQSGDDVRTRAIEVLRRNARLQGQLVSDLLDMSRIVSGKLRLELQTTDLAGVIQEAVETVRESAVAKGVELRTLLDSSVPHALADPARLQQVMWNLLTNAIKFTARGGHVDITLHAANEHAEITVADDGVGIRPDHLTAIFERFMQSDTSTTRRFGGLGLGLAIVKQVVQLHGGTIKAESAGEGHGARFTVSLPVSATRQAAASDAGAAAPDAAVPDHVGLRDVRVLLVEDNEDTRDMVRRLLEQHEAEVLAAASASEALELLSARRPDLLVSDIGLPDVDGYELMKQIRSRTDVGGDRLPAVALTAFARPEDRMRALNAGYQAHVAKPVDPSELLATVANLAGLIQARRQQDS